MQRIVVIGLLVVVLGSIARAADPIVKLTQEDNRVVVMIDGKPFTDYYYGPEGGRSYVRPFMWPVRAADGVEVTIDQSQQTTEGEPHQRSFWIGQGSMSGANHWVVKGDPARIQRHIKFDKLEGDTLVDVLEWEGVDKQPALREVRTVRFFEMAGAGGGPARVRGVDITSVYTAIKDPITFQDTKEAGLCSLRVTRAMEKTSTITQSTGATSTQPATEKNVWGKKADWCDISGRVDEKDGGGMHGIAVFDHPDNPRHPSNWHVRHYGLVAANIFGLNEYDKTVPKEQADLKVEKDKPTTFKYRVILHEGDAKSANLPALYDAWVKPKS